jgi:hypothetical protein
VAMEMMEHTMYGMVDKIVATAKAEAVSTKGPAVIDLSPLGARFIQVIESVHAHGSLLVDVKMDNFMLAYDTAKSHPKAKSTGKFGKASVVGTELVGTCARQLRVLDLGLIELYATGGHRQDTGISGVIGTPSYVSLNIHDGHTPSRRDDIESTLYVIIELALRIHAKLQGTEDQFQGKSRNGLDTYLPWTDASSDEDLGAQKKESVEAPLVTSKLFKPLPLELGQIFWSVLKDVRQYKYTQKPNYKLISDSFIEHGLLIPVAATNVATSEDKKRKVAATASDKSSSKLGKVASTTVKTTAKVAVSSKKGSQDETTTKASSRKYQSDSVDDAVLPSCEGIAAMDIDSENVTPVVGMSLFKRWSVGNRVSPSTSVAAVHDLMEKGRGTGWVVKFVPVAKPPLKSSNLTVEMRHYQSMNVEFTNYSCGLVKLSGIMLPRLPQHGDGVDPLLPGRFEKEDLSFLVLEKMSSSLFDSIPALVEDLSLLSELDVTPIAIRLFDMIGSVHKQGYILLGRRPAEEFHVDSRLRNWCGFAISCRIHCVSPPVL